MCESGGSALRRVSWLLVLRQDLQIHHLSFFWTWWARSGRAGHAGRGELGAGSLRLAKELLTVFMVLDGLTHLEWGYAITMSTSLILWNKGRNSFVTSRSRRMAGKLTFLRQSGARSDRTRTKDLHHCCSPSPVRHRPDEAGRECLGIQ